MNAHGFTKKFNFNRPNILLLQISVTQLPLQLVRHHTRMAGGQDCLTFFATTTFESREFPISTAPQSCLCPIRLHLGLHLHKRIFTGLSGCPQVSSRVQWTP